MCRILRARWVTDLEELIGSGKLGWGWRVGLGVLKRVSRRLHNNPALNISPLEQIEAMGPTGVIGHMGRGA